MKAFIATLLLAFSSVSQAALISFETDKTEYQVGETIKAQLNISQFSELLGGFSSDVLFDPASLALTSWQLGAGFDDGLGSVSDAWQDAAGILSFYDYADFSADSSLLPQPGDSFTLISIEFIALSTGNLLLDLGTTQLLSFFSNDFLDYSFSPLNLSVVAPSQVPAPASALLLLAGLALLHRRKA